MKNATHISILLDRSGSMGSIKQDVIGGFNNFLSEQKAVSGECHLTLTQFDTGGIDIIHEYKPLAEIPELDRDTYEPRGGTPLLDALAKTIKSTDRALGNIPELDRPDKVVFVVITDGEENSSREYSKTQIKELIERQEKSHNWNFVFLGANQDAFAEAGSMGVSAAAAASFTPDSAGVRASYAAASANMTSYRTSGNRRDLHWTSRQRASMGGRNARSAPTQPVPDLKSDTDDADAQSQPSKLNWQRR